MPLINNPGSTTVKVSSYVSPTPDGPLLHPHQEIQVADIVAAYRQDRAEFFVVRGMRASPASIEHPTYVGRAEIYDGDLVALERAGMIDPVSTNGRGEVMSFSPTALASAFVHPADYLNLSDEAWVVSKDTLRNRPERIRDVQVILRRICEDTENPSSIRATAQAADLLLDQVEKFIDTGNPGDEPLARASTASLRALALTILRFGGPEVLGSAVEAFREVLELLDA